MHVKVKKYLMNYKEFPGKHSHTLFGEGTRKIFSTSSAFSRLL